MVLVLWLLPWCCAVMITAMLTSNDDDWWCYCLCSHWGGFQDFNEAPPPPDTGSLSKRIRRRAGPSLGPGSCINQSRPLSGCNPAPDLTGHTFLHAGFRGFAQAHDGPIWVVLDSLCMLSWEEKKTFVTSRNICLLKIHFCFIYFLNNSFFAIQSYIDFFKTIFY